MPKNQIKISNVMIVQPPKREMIDIRNYTRSIKTADRGRRRQLIDVYDNIIKDPVLAESIRKRVRQITNGGLKFMNNSEEVPQMTEFIETPAMRKLLREILLTRFYGKSIIEMDFIDTFSIELLDRKNYDTAKKMILKSPYLEDGWPYEGDDFLLNVGEDDDLGYLMESAPFAIFKRNGGADYAEFCELWGIPILAALYDPDDDQGREEMLKTMRERGAAGSVVMSKNGEIKSISTEAKGAVHKEFLEWLDEQILIGTIGQTMTSKNGSALAQARVHADIEDDINEDDQIYVLEVLNHQLLPKLEKRGYPVGKGYFMYPERDNLSLKEKIEIAERVDDRTDGGVDDDYWFELTGIPRGKGKGNSKSNSNSKSKSNSNSNSKNDPPEGAARVTVEDHNLWQRVKDFFGDAPR